MPGPALHPSIDNGIKPAAKDFTGGTLTCHCKTDLVEVTISAQTAHNHACGCTKCWKPKGALFSVVAVVPRDKLKVTRECARSLRSWTRRRRSSGMPAKSAGSTCTVGSRTPATRSMAWTSCHTELSSQPGWSPPEFAAFVSSIIESGADPAQMGAVRARLRQLGLEPYDCLSPPLMDAIATHAAKASGVLKS